MGPQGLYQRMFLASSRCSHAIRHLVGFEAPEADPKSAPVIADAASLAVEAIITLYNRPGGRAATGRIGRVVIGQGPKPAAARRGGLLVIVVAPAQGLAGHPSSQLIEQAILAQ
jgi:hypothetical protein